MRVYFIYILFVSSFLFSQNVLVETDTNLIRIGEHINLKIKVYGLEKDSIVWPNNDTLFEPFELLDNSILLNIAENDTHVVHNYILTSFDTGRFTIPSIPIYSKYLDSLLTSPLDISVLSMPLDTTNNFFDIKPPKKIPLLARELIFYFIYLLLLILVIVGIILLVKYLKNKKVSKVTDLKPVIPIDVYYLNALADLEKKDYLKDEKYKDYYTELSEIFRGYLEVRFSIPALESSTFELKALLLELKIQDKWLNSFFRNNDIVKFAKGVPSKEDSLLFLESVRNFIKNFGVEVLEDEDLNDLNKL